MSSAQQFLHSKFQEYYRQHTVEAPLKIEQREFGIGEFGKKISSRHIAFANADELNNFLRNQVPFYISYSSAYYKYPAAQPMNAKHLLQADLIYEFDADDFQTECKQRHDSWECPKCKVHGKGAIENCTSCGAHVLKHEWICNECLEETKKQTLKLIDFLHYDFDIFDSIEINYSGSKGFHTHVRSAKILQLNQNARTELIDYLTANGLIQKNLGFDTESKMFICPKPESAKGWQKKILDWLMEVIKNSDYEQFAVYGNIPNALAKKLIRMRSTIISGINSGMLYQFSGGKAQQFWDSLIANAVDANKLNIDRQTSIDLHKIIRLPETLHGGTGLIAKKVSLEAFKEFNALEEAVAFGSSATKLRILSEVPKFELGTEHFGPFAPDEQTALPEHVAVYLLARNAAQLAE